MRLTKYDQAWLKRMTVVEQKQEPKQERRGPRSLLSNPEYIADIKSGMPNREIKDRWGVPPSTLTKHKARIKEAEL